MKEATCKQVDAICVPLEDSTTHMVQAKSTTTQCGFCGRQHPHGECPARGKTYIICNKKGPLRTFAVQRSKNKKQITRQQNHRGTKTVESTQQYKMKATDSNEEFYFLSVRNIPPNATEAYTKLKIGNKQGQIFVNAKIDTGAMSTLLPRAVLKKNSLTYNSTRLQYD